jgi:hypothetical protein
MYCCTLINMPVCMYVCTISIYAVHSTGLHSCLHTYVQDSEGVSKKLPQRKLSMSHDFLSWLGNKNVSVRTRIKEELQTQTKTQSARGPRCSHAGLVLGSPSSRNRFARKRVFPE